MASAALRSIGTRASCHRRNRRGSRFRETEYEMRASREPDSGSVGGFTILRRFLFLEIRSASRAGFSGDSSPRFRESPREHAPVQAPQGIRFPHTKPIRHKRSKHLLKKRRKTRWRVQRSEASAQERPATEEIVAAAGSERQNTKCGHRASPIREASEDLLSSDAFFFWKFGRPLVPGFPATACPGSGKVPANTRRHRLREVSSLRTRTVFRFRNENTAGRKNGRARRPPRSGCGRPLYFTASQSCRCNGRNIAETSRSTSETRSFFFRFQALCRLLRIISTSVRISRSGPNRPSSPPSPCKTLDYDGRSATENPTQQDSRPERLTTLPPDALRAAPKRLGIRSHRPESPAGAASVAFAHAAGISDTCSSAGTTRDRHRNNAAAGRSAIRGHGDELPQSVRFQSGNVIQKTDVPAAVPARSPDCRTAESCGP